MSANTSRVRHISTTSQDMPFPVAASIRRQHKAYNASDTPNFAGVPLWSARYPDTNKRRVASTLAGAGAEAVLAASSADSAVSYDTPDHFKISHVPVNKRVYLQDTNDIWAASYRNLSTDDDKDSAVSADAPPHWVRLVIVLR